MSGFTTAPPLPCPDSGYACPGCDGNARLTYAIKQNEYTCGECGLVSTVEEVVERGREIRREKTSKENEVEDWIKYYTEPDGRPDPDTAD